MAVIPYKLVYRDGASTGAPLASMYICDTIAERPVGVPGDLAYVYETQAFYMKDSTRWARNITEYATDFHGGIGVDGFNGWPSVQLKHSQLGPEQAWFALSPDAGYLTWNSDVGGTPFNTNKSAVVMALHNGGYDFNLRAAGGGYQRLIAFDMGGKIYERARSYSMGEVQYRTPSAGNFWGGGSMAIINVAAYTYQFSLIGNTYSCNWFFDFHTSGTAHNEMYMHIPGSDIIPGALRSAATTCRMLLWGVSHEMGQIYINQGDNYLRISRYALGNFPIGGPFQCSGSFTFMV